MKRAYRASRGLAGIILLAAALLACTGAAEESANERRMLLLEAKLQSLEESLAALDVRLQRLEESATAPASSPTGQWDKDSAVADQWGKGKAAWTKPDSHAAERTASLLEDAGGEVHYVEHPGRGDRAVLALPTQFDAGETPLIVSLHGFGSDSVGQAYYAPLHERINDYGFALLLPNGAMDGEGSRFWNPTDQIGGSAKGGGDDVAYLTELVARAENDWDFGHVYIFGYSNGGFMAYHMACKGMPDLRAVASLAGASYVEDSVCDGAPPVSALHIHGSDDNVIMFAGDETEPDPKSGGERAFYAGAGDMVARWSRRAGCEWPERPLPYATLDLDQSVPGAETQAFRVESGCAEGISVELWTSVGSGHAPDYGAAFADALASWFLGQE